MVVSIIEIAAYYLFFLPFFLLPFPETALPAKTSSPPPTSLAVLERFAPATIPSKPRSWLRMEEAMLTSPCLTASCSLGERSPSSTPSAG